MAGRNILGEDDNGGTNSPTRTIPAPRLLVEEIMRKVCSPLMRMPQHGLGDHILELSGLAALKFQRCRP